MKLKYVGAKLDGERAFKDKTGIEWFPGTVEDVPAAIAAEMLRHPDVFAPAEADSPVTLAAAKTPAGGAEVDDQDVDDAATQTEKAKPQAPADPLANMDDAAVRAYAKASGLKVQSIALLKGDKLKARVREAMAKS